MQASRATLAWEAAWPVIWPTIAALLVFLALAWSGLWLDAPVWLRAIGFVAMSVAAGWTIYRLTRLRPSSRAAALDHIDRAAPESGRAARAVEDTLALGSADPGTVALWRLHRRRAEARVGTLVVPRPRPGMASRDPYALRSLALLACVATAFVAGPEIGSRLRASLSFEQPSGAAPPFRIDGWVDPPHYTRLPPLMIDLASGEQHLRAPVGSTVVIRVAGQGEAELSPGTGLEPAKAADAPRGDLREYRYTLRGTTELAVRTGLAARAHLGTASRLRLEAIADAAPEISLVGAPEPGERGTFSLTYRIREDYGIAGAEARIERPDATNGRRSLVPAPTAALQLPPDPRSGEDTRTAIDLSDHPWAGARVRITLVARDEAGQEGHTAPVEFTLPQRPFTRPLAKALVEQRRSIILDPDNRRPVQLALDALLIAPDRFTPEWGVFLGLRAAAERFRAARSDAELTDVADLLWEMALRIEEGDLSDAERELQAAQERLREAMDRGADDKEIGRLAEDLKRAMDRFLREFAERSRENKDGERPLTGNERVISQNDLNRLLQEMQDAMKRGDTAEAQRLLDGLKNLLENLRTARPGNRSSDPMAREMSRQMDELDALTREQQELRDETYRQGQGRRTEPRGRNGQRGQPQGRRGQPGGRQPGGQQPGQGQQPGEGQDGGQEQAEGQGQDGQGSPGGLGERQSRLRERLQALQRRMRGMGMGNEGGLGDAEGAMKDAEGELGDGRSGEAVDSQGRALEGLQRGAQGMAQQMQRMMGENDGSDEGGEPGGPGNPQGRASNDPRDSDPLGRPTRSREFTDGRVRIPGANESAVERARRILDELRRKLGDPSRPQEELDYFERLLRRN